MSKSFYRQARAGLLGMAMLVQPLAFAQTVATIQEANGGVVVKTATDILRITVCSPTVLHIVASPEGQAEGADPTQPWIIEPCAPGKFMLTLPSTIQKQPPAASTKADPSRSGTAVLDTGSLKVSISLDSGSLRFSDEQGRQLLQEATSSPRRYEPIMAIGEPLYRAIDRFSLPTEEAIYGLGQHQSGIFNYRGSVVELAQVNTDVAIPLMVSTQGYGFFWNTAAKSWFDNRFPSQMRVSAEAAHAIDYYFIYGPEMDQIIHQYREMTGRAPLFPKWAYGFFQSKDRYKSAAELLSVAKEYRDRHVPLDTIVQDWYWWVHRGDPEFRPDAYPDVPGTLKTLHDEHLHAMLTVWPDFDLESANYQAMLARHFIIPSTTDYDATNPAAADSYWKNFVGKEFAQGWDAFWLDASEPEAGNNGSHADPKLAATKLFIGNGALYANVFPLMHTENIYRHWRATTDRKRVFILTRSGFAGEQRNAAAVWSGDVFSTFQAFTRQVPAGLNFALSGMPYWTTDIAGYITDDDGRDTRDPAYQELYTRWFEFGVFCPIFRTHGHRLNKENEIFSYGPVTPILESYDRLRYRLLPYIYSLAWNVTSADGTIMRPLVMDWRTDPKVWNIGDQFLFGPSILVSPVTEQGATSRSIYLPPAPAWYDFWTGKKIKGDQRIEVSAPLDHIPLYVKAGSILPLGPQIEYSGEKPDAPIELRVYRGADGSFDLYEDAGDTYAYEKGMRSVIPMCWDDKAGRLTIGARTGGFADMVSRRSFHVIFVTESHGAGPAESSSFDRVIPYTGKAVTVTAQ